MPSKHLFLAASGAPIWGHCSAAAQMFALFPGIETEESTEGEAAHWYGEMRIKEIPGPHPKAPNGVVLDDEMRESAGVYINDVQQTKIQYPGATLQCETFGHAREIHPDHCGGTVDCRLICHRTKTIITWNFKHGHKEVSAFENFQEMIYTQIIIEELGLNGAQDQEWTVENRIVQPRCYTGGDIVRKWRYRASALRPFINILRARATEALQPIPTATSGEHCEFCPGRHSCSARRKSAYSAMAYTTKIIPEHPTPEVISFELNMLERAIKFLEARYTGMVTLAEETIKVRKQLVPGWGLESTYGRLTWKISDNEVEKLGEQFGINLMKKTPVTPTQAAKTIIGEKLVKAVSHTPPSGTKLKRIDSDEIRRVLSQRDGV